MPRCGKQIPFGSLRILPHILDVGCIRLVELVWLIVMLNSPMREYVAEEIQMSHKTLDARNNTKVDGQRTVVRCRTDEVLQI